MHTNRWNTDSNAQSQELLISTGWSQREEQASGGVKAASQVQLDRYSVCELLYLSICTTPSTVNKEICPLIHVKKSVDNKIK